jgi:hypothetical protein
VRASEALVQTSMDLWDNTAIEGTFPFGDAAPRI